MDTKIRGDGDHQKTIEKIYTAPSPIKAKLLYPNF